jgi:Tol biopolymer transport system component
VAAESGLFGARLVAIDERGDRQFALIAAEDDVVRDTHPAISPDGRWLVFASSRGRPLAETSLWIAPLAAEAEPRPLTTGAATDSHPTWTPDGRAIVFASTRAAGNFDLFQLEVVAGEARGAPVQLTDGPGHEVMPSVARDGTIAYAAVVQIGEAQVKSHLEARAPDGTITRVSAGPADTAPAISPDGTLIAFARPRARAGAVDPGQPSVATLVDGELWLAAWPAAAPIGDGARQLIDLPQTDESGPVWSRDGRYLLSTSVLRGVEGNVVFSSVIVIDSRERPGKARIFADRIGPIARLTPAIATARLDAAALAANPEYLPELARIIATAIE